MKPSSPVRRISSAAGSTWRWPSAFVSGFTGSGNTGVAYLLLFVLGMDAALLLSATSLISVTTLVPGRLVTAASGFLLTLTGTTDFGTREYALDGSFAPASTFQKVVGKIPLVNWIFLGPHKAGFGATEFNNPVIDVKPLTKLTPGITRSIQEIFPNEEK